MYPTYTLKMLVVRMTMHKTIMTKNSSRMMRKEMEENRDGTRRWKNSLWAENITSLNTHNIYSAAKEWTFCGIMRKLIVNTNSNSIMHLVLLKLEVILAMICKFLFLICIWTKRESVQTVMQVKLNLRTF